MAAVAGAIAVGLTWHCFAISTVVFSLIFLFCGGSASSITGGDEWTIFQAYATPLEGLPCMASDRPYSHY